MNVWSVFQFLALINKVTRTFADRFLWVKGFVHLCEYVGVRSPSQKLMFKFIGNCQIILQTVWDILNPYYQCVKTLVGTLNSSSLWSMRSLLDPMHVGENRTEAQSLKVDGRCDSEGTLGSLCRLAFGFLHAHLSVPQLERGLHMGQISVENHLDKYSLCYKEGKKKMCVLQLARPSSRYRHGWVLFRCCTLDRVGEWCPLLWHSSYQSSSLELTVTTTPGKPHAIEHQSLTPKMLLSEARKI